MGLYVLHLKVIHRCWALTTMTEMKTITSLYGTWTYDPEVFIMVCKGKFMF